MLTSYHVHSRWSDGQTDIRALVTAAQEIGLRELGISDHYVMPPGGEIVSWSMPLDALPAYFQEIAEAADAAGPTLILRRGLEADYFPEQAGALREILAARELDFVIGAVHFVDGFPIDESVGHWEALSVAERDDVIRGYWVRIREMARSGLYDFCAHLDLTKKFGFTPSSDIEPEIMAALDAIAAAGLAVEINTAGWRTVSREAYPAPALLAACRERGIPSLINADAHAPPFLTRDFDRAAALLQEVGYAEVLTYARRSPHPVPLAEWLRDGSRSRKSGQDRGDVR
jgi:histidinol-phosphatase (PHP family)